MKRPTRPTADPIIRGTDGARSCLLTRRQARSGALGREGHHQSSSSFASMLRACSRAQEGHSAVGRPCPSVAVLQVDAESPASAPH